MKSNKIYLMTLLSMVLYMPFVRSVTIFLDTNQMVYLLNQQMRVLDDYFDAMREEMQNTGESMNREWQTSVQEDEEDEKIPGLLFDIEDKRDADYVAIVVEGINMDEPTNIQAKVEFDNDENPVKLLIDVFDRSICVDYTPQYRFLSVEIKHEAREEQKKNQQIVQIMQVGIARHGKILGEDIQLDQSQITFNKKEKTLIIAIPKSTKKKVETIIPIYVK